MTSVLEKLAPARLGHDFRWLLAAGWVSNLADGIAIAAGPLLVASQTDEAGLVALAALLLWLPPFAFGLLAGALADRLNRTAIVAVVNVLRALVLVALALTVLTDTVSIWVVLVALFLLGTAEVFSDNTLGTLLPMLVHRDDLAIANARLQVGFVTINQLAAPPIGAVLFTAGMAWPFVAQAVLVLLAVALVMKVVLPPHGRDADAAPTQLRHDILEGIRWAWHHPAVRTLTLTILMFNVTFGAAWSVLVLYATQRLGLGEIGFGLITTVSAVGGLLGTLGYGWITRHVSLAALMKIGLVVETLTHLILALTTSPYVAMPVFFVFGAHAFIWGTTAVTVRQRAVPNELQGRVGSVNLMGMFGGLVIGAGVGGVLAQRWGVTAPFWFAFVGSAIFVCVIWGQLRHIAHDEPAVAAGSPEIYP